MLFIAVNLLRQVVYMCMKYEQLTTDWSIITAGYFTVLV